MSNDLILCKGFAILELFFNEEDEDEKTQTIRITNDDLDWEGDGRSTGNETSYSATCDFGVGEIIWTVYEFPEGTIFSENVYTKIDPPESATIIKNFDSFDMAPEDIEIDYFEPHID